MITITLYTNTSPVNKVDKTITSVISVTGVLREGTSILDPIIEFELPNNSAQIVSSINYVYIQEFGRYYFITNIASTYNTLWEVHCHVDVLMTYKAEIRQQNCVVARQKGKYNMYLDDGWFMAYQNPRIQTKVFSIADPFETQEYVLVLAGT